MNFNCRVSQGWSDAVLQFLNFWAFVALVSYKRFLIKNECNPLIKCPHQLFSSIIIHHRENLNLKIVEMLFDIFPTFMFFALQRRQNYSSNFVSSFRILSPLFSKFYFSKKNFGRKNNFWGGSKIFGKKQSFFRSVSMFPYMFSFFVGLATKDVGN